MQIVDHGQLMYPRCCASYSIPLTDPSGFTGENGPVDSCQSYQVENINFCSQYTTVTECLYSHNPYDPQSAYRLTWLNGFGHGLDNIRAECLSRTQLLPGYNCSQMDLGPWQTNTNCIWCPAPGLIPIGGNGECRPGGDYGICATASSRQRKIFGLRLRSTCSDLTNCNLIGSYPDLAPFIGNYTFTPGPDFFTSLTDHPTTMPTKATNNPSAFPPKATGNPTITPTKATGNPPTKPTRNPTDKLTSQAATSVPTHIPSHEATFQPSQVPTSYPNRDKKEKKHIPTSFPTEAVRITSSPSYDVPNFGGF